MHFGVSDSILLAVYCALWFLVVNFAMVTVAVGF